MSPRKFGPEGSFPRNVKYAEARPAVLPRYRLAFNVPGLPGFEPCFANVEFDEASEVNGVAYRLSSDDFYSKVAASEGFPIIEPVSLKVDGFSEKIIGRTFRWSNTQLSHRGLFGQARRPSRRYVELMLEGADHWGLATEYKESLSRISTSSGWDVRENPMSLIYSPQTRPNERIRRFAETLDLRGPTRLLRPPQAEKSGRGLIVYCPGLDGTGLGILPHIEKLDQEFEVLALSLSQSANPSWSDLVQTAFELVRSAANERREAPVLVGESLGACLALSVAARLAETDSELRPRGLLVVNPATSYSRSPAAQTIARLPFAAFPPLFVAALPLLFDVPRCIIGTNFDDLPRSFIAMLRIPAFNKILPPEIIEQRLAYLSDLDLTDNELRRVDAPVQLAATENDGVLPSQSEITRLAGVLPNALTPLTVAGGGHAALLDRAFDIALYLQDL
eukprot:CAMPEP_0198331858 /NCGR_PEP_ID=MMETSP1450-20131203/17877_1 /TAXON_ID=753684 ORGANISM="Madagascaria erythrocladiodes, Strain CCMP3234" /NCGR_SAMPLE_ID=MMETSP1450 /ASSEMBLY_ACC=CAM_ASM_001115 /LENGTH=448 /DNA_ID=CAMNT_0044036275 /DNA_START=189 /DNA_END=1535 /DNA_ORIENTATION=+